MSNSEDIEYYRRRCVQERELARTANEGVSRNLHLDLASRYAARVEEVAESGRSLLSAATL